MGFKRKFQIGDKVKVIKTDDSRYNQIGEIKHYYSSYGYKGVYNVSFENGIRSYYPSSLEKVEESKEEAKTSEEIKLPLKEGQIITLLDGKKYQVINNRRLGKCSLCSLGTKGCNNCSICYINGIESCANILPELHYFKLIDSSDSTKEEISVKKESSIKQVGIITKVNFTLTDFKSEEIIHSKFTVL